MFALMRPYCRRLSHCLTCVAPAASFTAAGTRTAHKGRPWLRHSTYFRCKLGLLLWLTIFPASHAVQLTRIGQFQGQSVYSHSPVPFADNLGSLIPLAQSGIDIACPLDLDARHCSREICVFHGQTCPQASCFWVDVRAHEITLKQLICRALQRQEQRWMLCRVTAPLSQLPTEQYVLTDSLLPWHFVTAPVDLRPLQGSIQLVSCSRTSTCQEIYGLVSGNNRAAPDVVFRSGSTLLHHSSQPFLLPGGDSLQVGLFPQAPRPDEGASDRSDLSLSGVHPHSALRSDIPCLNVPCGAARTVVIYPHGLWFSDLDFEGSDLTSARAWVAFDQAVGHSQYVPRILRPTLRALPRAQILAAPTGVLDQAGVVDLRAVDGPVMPVYCSGANTVSAIVSQALQRSGVREAIALVEDYADLQVSCGGIALPSDFPLVATEAFALELQQLPHILPPVGADVAVDGSANGKSRLWALAPCLLVASPRAFWWALVASVILVVVQGQAGETAAVPSIEHAPPPTVYSASSEAMSVNHHNLLAQVMIAQGVTPLPPPELLFGCCYEEAGLVQVQVWDPSGVSQFALPYVSLEADLRHKLRALDPAGSRKFPTLVLPQIGWPCLQFVAPQKDPALVTVLVDTASKVYCLDVSRHDLAADIMRLLAQAEPKVTFRLDRGFVASVRHGEVIQAYRDETIDNVEIGASSLESAPSHTARWLGSTSGVYVVGPDIGLQRFTFGGDFAAPTIQSLLLEWLGSHRCQAVQLHEVQVPHYEAVVYSLPEPDRACHIFTVTDNLGHWRRPVVIAVNSDRTAAEALSGLAEGTGIPASEAPFWQGLLRLLPSVRFDSRRVLGALSPLQHHLQIDLPRAHRFGWRPLQLTQPLTRAGASASVNSDTGRKGHMAPMQGDRASGLATPAGRIAAANQARGPGTSARRSLGVWKLERCRYRADLSMGIKL